jgi:hypothetical protein
MIFENYQGFGSSLPLIQGSLLGRFGAHDGKREFRWTGHKFPQMS